MFLAEINNNSKHKSTNKMYYVFLYIMKKTVQIKVRFKHNNVDFGN